MYSLCVRLFLKLPRTDKIDQQGLPSIVPLESKMVSVACGRQQTTAVSAEGKLYTWGIGFEGALGGFALSTNLQLLNY